MVLTDIRMPPEHKDEGIRAAEHCRDRHPDMGVILLSQYKDPTYVQVLLARGTDRRGYQLKERVSELDDLLLALREVANGGSALDPKIVETLLARSNGRLGELACLTPREREVLTVVDDQPTSGGVAPV